MPILHSDKACATNDHNKGKLKNSPPKMLLNTVLGLRNLDLCYNGFATTINNPFSFLFSGFDFS